MLESMGIVMHLITQQSCCILLGIQARTQLPALLEIACTCTMLNTHTRQRKKVDKKEQFLCSRLCFSRSFMVLRRECYMHHHYYYHRSHKLCNHHVGLLGKWQAISENQSWKCTNSLVHLGNYFIGKEKCKNPILKNRDFS